MRMHPRACAQRWYAPARSKHNWLQARCPTPPHPTSTRTHTHQPCPLLPKVKAQLAAGAAPVRLVAGHNLYQEGEEADSFYMLQEGG